MALPQTMTRILAAAAVVCGIAIGPASAQGTDPADLAYWQSIQASTDAAEYSAYLQAFPTGTFAALARARIQRLGGDAGGGGDRPARPVARIMPDPAPAPEPEPVATVDEKIIVTPQPGHVGDNLKFTCVNFPKPYYLDMVIVVRAGSPDTNPLSARDDLKILTRGFPQMCRDAGFLEMGPFAPGRYEVRYVSALYNDDHTPEIRTRTSFVVR